YVRMANVLIWGKDENEVEKAARELSADIERMVFEQAGEQWAVLPATPCVLSRLRGTYRWHIVVKAPVGDNIAALLLPLFRKRKASKTVNVAVDVDPHDML
ncbi:MAG: primosomal protein N', partial [Raoultibacter sp.]